MNVYIKLVALSGLLLFCPIFLSVLLIPFYLWFLFFLWYVAELSFVILKQWPINFYSILNMYIKIRINATFPFMRLILIVSYKKLKTVSWVQCCLETICCVEENVEDLLQVGVHKKVKSSLRGSVVTAVEANWIYLKNKTKQKKINCERPFALSLKFAFTMFSVDTAVKW